MGLLRDEQDFIDSLSRTVPPPIENNAEAAVEERSNPKLTSKKSTSLIFLTMAGEVFSLSKFQEQIADIGSYGRYSSS
jgi:hypothetical protein